MPKKLLMNNCSENELMPVMDGLIGWYDARDKNADNTYLIDKSGNGNNISCKSDQVSIGDKSIQVRVGAYSETLDYSPHINGEITLMYCIDSSESSQFGQLKCMSGRYVDNLGWWIRPINKCVNIWYKSKKYINDNDGITEIPRGKIMVAMTWSSTKISMYINGVLFASRILNNIFITDLSLALFGETSYRGYVSYEYFSSYIYNRALTEKEIQQNYLYEQSIERGENSVR